MSFESRLQHASTKEAKRKAYEATYDEYHGLVAFVAGNTLHDPSLREDVVQETFLALFQSDPSSIRSVKAFLCITAKNKSLDANKRRSFEPLGEEPSAPDDFGLFLAELKELLGEEDYALLYDYVVAGMDSKSLALDRGLSP
ncbi:MAG: hypothetical protein IJS52_09670, partial [Bacilli bacterium]|nr:hypothetical protein [Bacilli bacterium]